MQPRNLLLFPVRYSLRSLLAAFTLPPAAASRFTAALKAPTAGYDEGIPGNVVDLRDLQATTRKIAFRRHTKDIFVIKN